MDIETILANLEAYRDDIEEKLRKLGFEEENAATHTLEAVALNRELGDVEDQLAAARKAEDLIRQATQILNQAGLYV